MDQGLESYIEKNAKLQAAFVHADFRSDPSKIYYNNDFKAVSRPYLFQDKNDEGHDPIKNKANTTNFIADGMYGDVPPIDSSDKLTPFEEAYLALDESDDEEFERWFDGLNNGLEKQPISNTTMEKSDVAVNDNSKETYGDFTDNKKSLFKVFDKVEEHSKTNNTSFNSQPGLPGINKEIEPKMSKSQSQRYGNGKWQNNYQPRNPFKTPRKYYNNRMNEKRRQKNPWSAYGDKRSTKYKNRTNNTGSGFVNDNTKGILPNRQQLTMHNGSTINRVPPADVRPTVNCGGIPTTSVCNNAAFQNMCCNGYGEMNIPSTWNSCGYIGCAGASPLNIPQTPLQAIFSGGNYCQNCCGCSRYNILNNGANILNELFNLSASCQLGSQVDEILSLI